MLNDENKRDLMWFKLFPKPKPLESDIRNLEMLLKLITLYSTLETQKQFKSWLFSVWSKPGKLEGRAQSYSSTIRGDAEEEMW